MNQISDLQLISVSEALERFEVLKDNINSYGSEDDKIIFCDGDCFINSNLEIDFHSENWRNSETGEATGLLINGNLTVEGTVSNMEGDFGPFLLVIGKLTAKNIDKGGSEFYITGDCKAENVIYGYYNHGSLIIDGEASAKFLINDDHCIEYASLSKSCITVNNYGDYDDFDYYSEDIPKNFVKDVLDDDKIDISKFIKRLDEGKKVLKSGAKPSRVIVEEKIKKIVEKGGQVLELDLKEKKLKQFPKNILEMKSLKKLNLNGNPIENIPDDIDRLENLEELYIESCDLEDLPKSICNLANLRVLDISGNQFGKKKTFLKNIGNLQNLKVLSVNYNSGFHFPDSMEKLVNLEELNAYQYSDAKPIDFPEVICKLKSLKKLNLGSNSFKTIPDSFTNLKNLEELNLNSSLCYLESLPDLSNLKKLKALYADGLISYTTRPYPSQSLLKSFYSITSLQELYIDRHGRDEEVYSEETLESMRINMKDMPKKLEEFEGKLKKQGSTYKGVVRDSLKAEHLEGISNLNGLKLLDLSFNRLESLPEEIFELKNLTSINLEYNSLPKNWRERIVKEFPNTKIDFRNQRLDEPEETGDLKKVIDLVKKAGEKRYSGDYNKAIKYYDQALEFFNDGKVTHEYNLIYIHYSKMWIYAQLAYHIHEKPKEDIENYGRLYVQEAYTCMSLVPANINVWHFTDEGQFHQEVIRYACNCIAWNLFYNNEDKETLENALSYAKRGAEYATAPSYYYVIDTRVRILLKLGRRDEAYGIVKKILKNAPDFSDFQDFKHNEDYVKWAKKNK